jgi:thiamine pyrophosphate-dependent acetolactate synthase large subunit-like protein
MTPIVFLRILATGNALFSAAEIHMPVPNQFLTSGFWASLGFALPAAIGAYFAESNKKPVAMVGDGAFLMCANELATLARYKVLATVIIFDNAGWDRATDA